VDLKTHLDLRPVHHRTEGRIPAHVQLCWLALLLVRIAETGDPPGLGADLLAACLPLPDSEDQKAETEMGSRRSSGVGRPGIEPGTRGLKADRDR